MKALLLAAWRYRFFIVSSIKTEFRSKFVRSALGGLWMILNPLSQVLIFAFVLSAVLSAKLPGITNQYAYAIYLMAGTLGWSLFAEIVNRCLTLRSWRYYAYCPLATGFFFGAVSQSQP